MKEISRDEGFFKQLHKNFRNKLTKNDVYNFASLKSDSERVDFVFKRVECNFPFTPLKQCKSSEESQSLKQQGNKFFRFGDNKKALEFYSESMIRFPENGDKIELSIIRANRSAAFYHMQMYELALIDIQIAKSLGYPKNLMYKILDRKALCLLALKQNKTAVNVLRETIVSLDDAKLPLEQRQRRQKDIEITTSIMMKDNIKDEKIIKDFKLSKINGEHNKVYGAATRKIDIKFDDQMGRFAEAKLDIQAGEVILKEKSHCAVLSQEMSKTHCFHCFKRIKAAEACPYCVNVRFCSQQCKEIALKTHHSIECGIMETLWNSGASITCYMALRIISQKTLHYFLRLKEQLKENDGPWAGDEYNGSNYLTVYQLVRHEKARNHDDLLHRSHMAAFLLFCLIKGNYFKDLSEDTKMEAEIYIGGLLLRQLQLLQFNAHEISELTGNSEKECKNIFIGGGLYPTLALFNHSCEPAIIRCFEGTTVVVRAIKSIKAGEMIAENYGPIFTQVPKHERKETLKGQYWFDCKCVPCEENWPLLSDMDPTVLRFLCENKSCKNVIVVPSNSLNLTSQCSLCGKHVNILKGLKLLQDTEDCFKLGESLLNEGQVVRAMKKFIELHNLLSDVLAPPYKDYYVCQQKLRFCFMCFGNRE